MEKSHYHTRSGHWLANLSIDISNPFFSNVIHWKKLNQFFLQVVNDFKNIQW